VILAVANLESVSPYSQAKHYVVEREGERELDSDYEARTWRERLNVTSTGNVFIPPMAFKNCIAEAAKYLSESVKGKGKSTYTKHFESGILVLEGLTLSIKKEQVDHEWLFVPSDGKRGGERRVNKCFPVIHHWQGDVTFHVLDEIITEDVFLRHLKRAGQFIGLGRFRPRRNGYYGRFKVNHLSWTKVKE
jgi:hypothetical protein